MESNRCSNCGAPRRTNEERCPYCHSMYTTSAKEAQTAATYASQSNYQSTQGSATDSHSNTNYTQVGQGGSTTTQGSGRRFVAALLALLGGTIGLHWFYLGRIGKGIFYALLSATVVPTILGVVTGIKWLLMSDEAFDSRY